MNPSQQTAILTIALLAAFADGEKADAERESIRRIADSLSGENNGIDLSAIYQDVLLKRVSPESAAAALDTTGLRQLAYEMAVCVCHADGATSAAERDFLGRLQQLLMLNQAQAATADEMPQALSAAAAAGAAVGGEGPVVGTLPNVPEAELDRRILNHAILNGALELLPQSWASMAIIPLQIKLVYQIGKAHGYELDKGHITEFLTTAGVGMTSQYLEQFGRKLIGGLLGQLGGGLGKSIGRAATGMAFSFATTYALGQLAKRYYAGGRQMDTALLSQTFQSLLTPAKQLQQQYLPQIQQKAATLDAA
ncbi:MAG: GTPase, partial [Methylobacterium sp.]|nr:GTPase [Methylobacterium sp.]